MAMKQTNYPVAPFMHGMPFQTSLFFDFNDVLATTVANSQYLKDRDGNEITVPANTLVEITCDIEEVFNSGTSDVITVGSAAGVDTYLAAGDINEGVVGEYPALTKVKKFKPAAAFKLRAVWVATYAGGGAPTTGKARVTFKIVLEDAD
jgi:hypothetical protein